MCKSVRTVQVLALTSHKFFDAITDVNVDLTEELLVAAYCAPMKDKWKSAANGEKDLRRDGREFEHIASY
jgi:hypothetical protein